jgi:uncharacterized protein (DUF983 family)
MYKKKCPECREGTYSSNRNMKSCVECGADIIRLKQDQPQRRINNGIQKD